MAVLAATVIVVGVIFLVLRIDVALKDVRLPLVLLTSIFFLASGVIFLLAIALWRIQSVTEVAHTVNIEDVNKHTIALAREIVRLRGQVEGLLESYDRRNIELLRDLTSWSQEKQADVSDESSATEVVHTLDPEVVDRLAIELAREFARFGSQIVELLESHDRRSMELLRALVSAQENQQVLADAPDPTEARRRPETLGPARPRVGPRGT